MVFKFSTSKSSTFVFELFKLVVTLNNLLMSRLPTSAFNTIKSLLAAELDVSIPVHHLTFSQYHSLANLILL